MAVLLADRQLGVRRRGPAVENTHGELVVGSPGALVGPWPGRAHQETDGSWLLGVDPAAWPFREDDVVVDPAAGVEWTVLHDGAELMTSTVDPSINYVRVRAMLRPAGYTDPSEGRGPG